jgi:hypothetical protein
MALTLLRLSSLNNFWNLIFFATLAYPIQNTRLSEGTEFYYSRFNSPFMLHIANVSASGTNATFATANTACQDAFNTAMAVIVAAASNQPTVTGYQSNIMEASGGGFTVQMTALVKYTTAA